MADTAGGVEMMDHPEILGKLLSPRRAAAPDRPGATNHRVTVADGIGVVCRFFRARADGPNILFFHGNSETAADYDAIAPHYGECGLNLFVAEYRGYGMSDGEPTCSALLADAHPVFLRFASLVREAECTGPLFVMGRSLGSAPAIEVACRHQERLNGLIVASGFASARKQLERLGAAHLFPDLRDPVGFGNDLKIRSVRIPTLILHGEADKVIPVEEGRELYSLSGARDKTALFVPQAGHNSLMKRALNRCMECIGRFTAGAAA